MTTLLTSDPSTLVTILGVTATLLLLANILQAVAAIANKGKVQDTLLELHHAYKDLSKAIAERDQAKAEAKQADRLRDECEKTMRAAMDENDRMMTERASLYFRNSKGQIAKLHP
jgi:biopolymer transport protein ExbB/TolQ